MKKHNGRTQNILAVAKIYSKKVHAYIYIKVWTLIIFLN